MSAEEQLSLFPRADRDDGNVALEGDEDARDEERAWQEVLGRWSDDGVHDAFLARFADLDGLARAGRLYRDFLAARPGDVVAVRWRDEILKRAASQGLAGLPRTPPADRRLPPWLRSLLVAMGMAVLAGLLLALGSQIVEAIRAVRRR